MTEPGTHKGKGETKKLSIPAPGLAAGAAAMVGTVISDRYMLQDVIGEGGMAAVYLAEHLHMKKRVAIKVLHPEMTRLPEVVARFEREAMAASHIEHPNVAAATDFGKLPDGSFFLVLEYIEGKSLRDVINEGRVEPRRAMHVLKQVAAALARAHALGIVHRDLKPENVMLVERDGDRDFVKVLDFGIAKVPVGELSPASKGGPVLTQLGMVYGTPEYMAPEQALGEEVDARADLYSLGVMAYEMLTGRRPYEHDSKVTLLGMHVTAPVPSLTAKAPDLVAPLGIEPVVQKLLAKDASARYADAKEVIEAIDPFLVAGGLAARGKMLSTSTQVFPFGPPSLFDRAQAWFIVQLERLRAALPMEKIERALPWKQYGVEDPLKVLLLAAGALVLAGGLVVTVGLVLTLRHVTRTPDAQPVATSTSTAATTTGTSGATAAPTGASTAPASAGTQAAAPDLEPSPIALEDAKAKARSGDEAGFTTLERMGAAGLDALYELAYGQGTSGVAATRARKSLAKPELKAKMSPALAVTMEIRNAPSCEAKKKHFAEAKTSGDERTLAALSPYYATKGCGFANSRDCWPCMRGGEDSLAKTTAAIKERVKK
jgi:serine/threonine-protein kinase